MKIILTAAAACILIFTNNYSYSQSFETKHQDCYCMDGGFSKEDDTPLFTHEVQGENLSICGFTNDEIAENLSDKDDDTDTEYFLSGFSVFDCYDMSTVFEDSEAYQDIVKLNDDNLEITRLVSMPYGKDFDNKLMPAVSYIIKFNGDAFYTDTSFVFPAKKYNQQYLVALKKKFDTNKKGAKIGYDKYYYFLSYTFINAVLYPEKYSSKFKDENYIKKYIALDGESGEAYNEMMDYYKVFEKTKIKPAKPSN